MCSVTKLVAITLVLACPVCGIILAERARSAPLNGSSITAYPQFAGVCSAFVVGYHAKDGPRLYPQWGNFAGNCSNNTMPVLFSVTHENDKNNHIGSANYNTNIAAYMGDLDVATDLGHWIDAKFTPAARGAVLTMSLDTVNYRQRNVTGWPLQFGHLFFGANDLSVKSTLDRDITIDFDLRVPRNLVKPEAYRGGYSGHRIMIGAKLEWDEATPRTNRSHYLEVDLIQSNGYAASYGDPKRPLCQDAIYDRCFYSADGKFAEGRELGYRALPKHDPIPTDSNDWVHVHIPLSELCQKLKWVSPPRSWDLARLSGLYIGIESEGAAQATLEVRNYQVYAVH